MAIFQTSLGALSKQLRSVTRGKGKKQKRLLALAFKKWDGALNINCRVLNHDG